MEDIRQSPVRVCALESQPIVAQGLSEAFARHGGLTLAGWCRAEDELAGLITAHTPHVLLLDPVAAGGSLLALTSRVSNGVSGALVWSEGLSPAEKRLVGGLGAASIVERDLSSDAVIALCLQAANTQAPGKTFERDAAAELERGARRLTPKEAEVARLASAGLKNREIAETLGIAQGTVKVHLMHVFEKTGLRDRQQLSGLAARLFAAPEAIPSNQG